MNKKEIKKKFGSGELVLKKVKFKEGDKWKLFTREEWAQIKHAKEEEAKFDLLQLTKKIQLNSTYGALLNVAFRFGDERMGASVTATGRQITTHMIETISEQATGKREPLEKETFVDKSGKLKNIYKSKSPAIIYGDTDSCYFNTFAEDKDEAIARADKFAKAVNDSFPEFMREAFNCQPGFDGFIKANREIVGRAGIFYNAKKKYVIRVIDKEGKPADEQKVQGSEIKKSDTPRRIQEFLKELMNLVLDMKPYEVLEEFVNSQRRKITGNKKDIIKLGVIKAANDLDRHYDTYIRLEKTGKSKAKLSGHARAAINYNEVVQHFEGKTAKLNRSGDKVMIFYLKPNQFGIKSIAFPSDTLRFPKWFEENFKVDVELTEQKMIDSKLEGTFEALGHEVPTPQLSMVKKFVEY